MGESKGDGEGDGDGRGEGVRASARARAAKSMLNTRTLENKVACERHLPVTRDVQIAQADAVLEHFIANVLSIWNSDIAEIRAVLKSSVTNRDWALGEDYVLKIAAALIRIVMDRSGIRWNHNDWCTVWQWEGWRR